MSVNEYISRDEVEHISIVNALFAIQNKNTAGESGVYLWKASLLFDLGMIELLGWFLGGGRLAILERDGEKDPLRLLKTIANQRITHINFVPAMFKVFVEVLNHEHVSQLSSLEYIILAGETLLPEWVNRIREIRPQVRLEHLYGSAEATVYASRHPLPEGGGIEDIPMGKPLRNVKLYILDRRDRLQPVGIPGELCIAGAGAARGYLNHPEFRQKLHLAAKYF